MLTEWADLNDDEFPINTPTYPITRGIRVEIACTVIVFLFGLMSQFKIWKVLKEKRERRDADRLRWDESREQLEEAVGNDIEARNERERARWEAVYGDRRQSVVEGDSGVGSSIETIPKKSMSVREQTVDSIAEGENEALEMLDMPAAAPKPSGKSEPHHVITARVASEDQELQSITGSQQAWPRASGLSRSPSFGSRSSAQAGNTGRSLEQRHEGPYERDRSDEQASPAVVPLPFTILAEGDEERELSGDGLSGTRLTTRRSAVDRRGMDVNHLTLRDKDEEDSTTAVSLIDDDNDSSVAATIQEDPDADAWSAPRLSQMPSPCQSDGEPEGILRQTGDGGNCSSDSRRSLIELPIEDDDEEAIVRPRGPGSVRSQAKPQRRQSASDSQRRSTASRSSDGDFRLHDDDSNVFVAGDLTDHLPQMMSKAARTYRTNEWAKHSADADQPDQGTESESTSPGIHPEYAFAEEAARPVDVEALRQVIPTVDEAGRNQNPYRQSPRPSRTSPGGSSGPVYAFEPGQPRTLARDHASLPRLATAGVRNASAPLTTQALMESPIENVPGSSTPYRNFSDPLDAMSVNNLMDQRNQRLRNKATSTSFSPPNRNLTDPSGSASGRDLSDSDNLSLSDRKRWLVNEQNSTLAQRKANLQRRHQQQQQHQDQDPTQSPVSYTHLTLPTKRIV